MKANWIKRGSPVVALLFLVAFGLMSCSSDPMSSPDNGSSNISLEATNTVPSESPVMETPLFVRLSGHLRLDVTGNCWYLIIGPANAYELRLGGRIRAEENGRQTTVEGIVEQTVQPRCSDWPVFKVAKLHFWE
jgi:hypothetical protein